ncbi:hypothetical protein [Streptomyces sp. NPDC001076]
MIKALLAPGWDVLAIRTEDGAHMPLVPGHPDTADEFARLYHPDGPTGFVVRPGGHLGARCPPADTETALADYREALG